MSLVVTEDEVTLPDIDTFMHVLENEYLPIDPDTRQPERTGWQLREYQDRVIRHCFTPVDNKLPYDTVVISDIKKSGKTAIGAAIAYAWARTYGGEMYALANSKEHAADRGYMRVFMFLDWLKKTNKSKYKELVESTPTAFEVMFKGPFARFEAVPCEAGTQAGAYISFSLWDELWSYKFESLFRLWAEFSPIPQLFGRSIRLVVTYAGYFGESQLLWDLYDATVKPSPEDANQGTGIKAPGLEDLPAYISEDGRTFAYWSHGPEYDHPSQPWHTEEFMKARWADRSISEHEKRRLWRNEWTTGVDNFLNIERVDTLASEGTKRGLYNRMLGGGL